ncbi:MAG: protein phosphatase 2C domain-containing protein [Proteobacteria bacterium]|nr:MAG: protein phosphatase 2C domain-containing protein [Pseudomonadota bacterium]
MEQNNWQIMYAASTGLKHSSINKNGQDRVYSLESNGVLVIALADGAGSYKYPEQGAELVCQVMCNELSSNFEDIYSTNLEDVINLLCNTIQTPLKRLSSEIGCDIYELSSTLLCVAIKDGRYIALHVGDGIIGYNRDFGTLEPLSLPENGETPNSTFMTTGSNLPRHLRVLRDRLDNISGFMLMSDGSGHVLFSNKEHFFGNNAQKLINLIQQGHYHQNEVNQFVEKLLVPNCKVFDDCSLNIMTLINNLNEYKPDNKINVPLEKHNIVYDYIKDKRRKKKSKYKNMIKRIKRV